jgi:hypothetical protein
MMLPIMAGSEVLRERRRMPGLRGVPVALMRAVALGVKREDHGWQAFLGTSAQRTGLEFPRDGAATALHRIGCVAVG